jgi:hypothetical protein
MRGGEAATLTFVNTSPDIVNVARSVPGRPDLIAPVAPSTTSAFTIGGSNTFRAHVARRGTNYVIEGVVRQVGRGTPAASCFVYGYAIRVPDVA